MKSFDHITISTPRLLLRPLQNSDQPAVLALRSHPLVTRFVPYTPYATLEDAARLIVRDRAAMASGDYCRLGLLRHGTDQVMGICILFHIDLECRRAEIGYELHPDMWGQGYMKEALEFLLHFGFTELGLNRVEADVSPDNQASIKTLLRMGFQQEGRLRERWIVNGVKSDAVYFGMLLSDWMARQ